MALTPLSIVLSLVLPLAPSAATEPTATPAALALLPPVLKGSPTIAYPEDAPVHAEPLEVRVRLRVSTLGQVTEVQLVAGAGEPFDSAVINATRAFVFEPGRYLGHPVVVDIDFSQIFTPPPIETRPANKAVLQGVVLERGTREPVADAAVTVSLGEQTTTISTNSEGRFRADVPAGVLEIRVIEAKHSLFVQRETLAAQEVLSVKYLLDRETTDAFETVVISKAERHEISRTSLSKSEIHHMPGTFGDPFRVVSALPSMNDVSALLPMVMTRGSSPAHTGFLLDGVEIPMLYHLLAGPAVIHPELISRVDAYASAFPSELGGYTGGIVNGITGTPEKDARYELDLTITQAGAFVRQPVPDADTTATVAARVGYPGLLIKAVSRDTSLDYWDYQARFDQGSQQRGLSLMVFGARDLLQTRESFGEIEQPRWHTVLDLGFHRADLRFHHTTGMLTYEVVLVGGFEQTAVLNIGKSSWLMAPQAKLTLRLAEALHLRLGLAAQWRRLRLRAPPELEQSDTFESAMLGSLATQASNTRIGSAYVEAISEINSDLRVTVGTRADLYSSRYRDLASIDPRFTARYHIAGESDLGVWLKGATGWYHQPPRPFLPLPGGNLPTADDRLSATLQSSLGAEVVFDQAFALDVEVFFNAMDPLYGEPRLQPPVEALQPPANSDGVSEASSDENARRIGRAYGAEALLRRRDRGDFFGWLSYAWTKSQRLDSSRWVPFDLEIKHKLTAVIGTRLGNNWELGGRFTAVSGYPVTTAFGYNEGQRDFETRIDLRIDKRAVWNDWILDFYVDIINASANRLTLVPGDYSLVRFVLPTVGFRAVL